MPQQRYVSVKFEHFKAFKEFELRLKDFNILIGPNNAGKSTILTAFRILAAALRKANSRRAEFVNGPNGQVLGHNINLEAISVGEENLFYNYDNSEPAVVTFTLSDKSELVLFFPSHGSCFLLPKSAGVQPKAPAEFRKAFDCSIGFVPILGPVEHDERLYEQEAARLALFNYRAARNFRNIWYHFSEKFEDFRKLLRQTWPGMDIQPPELGTGPKPNLYMFCPEERIPREIFWAGFGFQVWCQMLTHIVQSEDKAIFLIDEPDIYLHSDLQRHLVSILRNLGPDILIATHSTEIITEAEPDDLVIINKKWKKAKRVKNPNQLVEVFSILGSNLNPVLTQLAKTRKVLFVEGKDFQILGKIAQRLGKIKVSRRQDFAVVPVEGFNPERVRSMKQGMEKTLGQAVDSYVLFDRDYRSQAELDSLKIECKKFVDTIQFLDRKEIENFLLVPAALKRAITNRISDYSKRTGKSRKFNDDIDAILDGITNSLKSNVIAQKIGSTTRFLRDSGSKEHQDSISQRVIDEIENEWADSEFRIAVIPGKQVLSQLNEQIQKKYKISITPTGIIDAMKREEVPSSLKSIIDDLVEFSS